VVVIFSVERLTMTNPFDELAKEALEEYRRGETTPLEAVYTEGPWEQSGTLIYRNGPEGGTICEMSSLRASNMVEHKRLELNDPDWNEQMANARLIAAAPDLVEALRFAVDYLVGAPGGEVSPVYLTNRLLEALQKAGVEE
jgi:hypothetical protein